MSMFTKRIAAAMLSVAVLAPLGTVQAQSVSAPNTPAANRTFLGTQRTVRGTQGGRTFMGRRHHKHRRSVSQFRGMQQHHQRHHHV